MSWICDRSITDLERISTSPGIPLSWSSSGIVINSSTCCEELPIAMVWISTCGGANSGKTSTSALRVSPMPKTISAAAAKITSHRNRKLDPTIQRISNPYLSMCDLELGAVHLGGPDRHDLRTGGWAVEEHDAVTDDVVDNDLLPHIGPRLGRGVSVRVALGVVDDGAIGHDRSLAVLANRGGLDAGSLYPFGVDCYAVEVSSLDRRELGGIVMACRLVVIIRTRRAACGKRYNAGDQHETRAGGPKLPPALTVDAQSFHYSPRLPGEPPSSSRKAGALVRPGALSNRRERAGPAAISRSPAIGSTVAPEGPGVSATGSGRARAPKRRYRTGSTNRLSNVEVMRPP